MGHCFLYALTIQVSLYDIDFFGSSRVLMLRVIILKRRDYLHLGELKQQISISKK
jgi:hypothetical protein